MAAVTVYSDFGAQENKICHWFHFIPFICHEMMWLVAMILEFLMLIFKPVFSLSSFTLIKRFKICKWIYTMKVKVLAAQSCLTLCSLVGCSLAMLLCPWNSPGKDTGVGWHSFLQGIFPTQGWNLSLLHCKQTILSSEPPGKPHTHTHTHTHTHIYIYIHHYVHINIYYIHIQLNP